MFTFFVSWFDNYFDFTCCNGVLAHLHNLDEVKKAIGELSRVTKPNGFLYISSGSSNTTAGLLENVIVPATRSYYENNINFKKFIDELSPKDFNQIIDFISEKMKKHTNEKIILENVPFLTDIEKMGNILKNLGVNLVRKNNQLEIDPTTISIKELPYELVKGLPEKNS